MLKCISCFVFIIYFSLLTICFCETFEAEAISLESQSIESKTEDNETNTISKNIKFFLFTRKNPLQHQIIQLENLFNINQTYFNPEKPVKILVHGWKCSHQSAYNILIKNAYLTQYNVNVIVVDWNKYSVLSYLTAKDLVSSIANVLVKFVDKLCEELGINPNYIHIVGHSLGAHIAGIAGQRTAKKVGRVTGLDPAGPFFSINSEERISEKSAKFVDVMHTDGGGAGFYHSLGHVDFYPNGGTAIQPGCGMDVLTLRSHRRAYWLFAESITTPYGFSAVSCDSWSNFKTFECEDRNKTYMGEHVSKSARGNYYLFTNSRSPYALENLVRH